MEMDATYLEEWDYWWWEAQWYLDFGRNSGRLGQTLEGLH